MDGRKHPELERWPDARRDLERLPRPRCDPEELRGDDVCDVVIDLHLFDAARVPRPALLPGIEGEEPVDLHRPEELAQKEWIAVRLIVDEVRERGRRRGIAAEHIHEELADGLWSE